VLGGAAGQLSPAEVHLYVIDCSAGSFHRLRELDQCGAVVDRDDPLAVARLIARLGAEIARRQKMLVERGLSSLAEAHRAGIELPAVVLGLDGWEGFCAFSEDLDAGRSVDDLLELLREGPATGLTVVVTGDRSALGARLSATLTRKLVLPLTDRADYLLAGIRPTDLPARLRPGLAVAGEDGLLVQLALLDPDPAVSSQWTALLAGAVPAGSVDGPTIVFRPLAESIDRTALEQACLTLAQPARSGQCLLGRGGDDAAPIWCDLFAAHSRFLVAGPARSGRSTTAITIADQAHTAQLEILLAAPTRSPLHSWASARGLPVLRPDTGESTRASNAIAPELVIIDDSEVFGDTETGDWLLELLRRQPSAVIATCRSDDLVASFRGIGPELRRHRSGLLLQPGPADGQLLGIRSNGQRGRVIPGRGLLVTEASASSYPDGLIVQVAR
jgi:S-DNA-T family DNA segregation ATPase FtsK/SpoIIIE